MSKIIVGFLLAIGLLSNCVNDTTASASGRLDMVCSYVNASIIAGSHFLRCENPEVVCYLINQGVSCLPK